MPYDPRNIRLGPCRVIWGGAHLGVTKGGVQVEVTTSTKEVTVDQFGDSPVNEYITGRRLTVTCPFAETDIDTLHAIMRNTGSTVVNGGVRASGTITIGATNAAANDTVVVNGVTFTFRAAASATGVLDVPLSANGTAAVAARESLAALCIALQTSTDPRLTVATYALTDPNTITVTYWMGGTVGNNFTLARTGTAITVSGANLTGGTAAGRKRVEVVQSIGTSIQASAQRLILRPVDRLDNDFSEDFVVPLAGTSGALQFAYELDNERLFNVTFNGYPDPTSRLLFVYGDIRSI